MKGTNYEAMTISPCTFNCSIFSYINKHKEWSRCGFFVTKMLTSTLHRVSSLDFANACDLRADKFVGWECVIVRYNLLIYFFSSTLPCFFWGGDLMLIVVTYLGALLKTYPLVQSYTRISCKKNRILLITDLFIIIVVGLVSNDGLL